jgi:hypothetical protein
MFSEIDNLNVGGKRTAEAVMRFIKADAITLAKMIVITSLSSRNDHSTHSKKKEEIVVVL